MRFKFRTDNNVKHGISANVGGENDIGRDVSYGNRSWNDMLVLRCIFLQYKQVQAMRKLYRALCLTDGQTAAATSTNSARRLLTR